METVKTISELRAWVDGRRGAGDRIGFVPTMGALHGGHRSCVDVARAAGDVVVVSIFVNPTQFGPGEDFEKYPRPIDADLEMCREWGVDMVFAPTAAEMYPVAQSVWVEVTGLTDTLCGKSRSGHFRGVTTVVMKLFGAVRPDVAVFGQKDAQQAVVINEMVRQLSYPVDIALSETVREPDGLAVSSRNRYLSPSDRARAAGIHRALRAGFELIAEGERTPSAVVDAVRRSLDGSGIEDIEYVELVNTGDLRPPRRVVGRVLLAVAARVGGTRLIDNIVIDVDDTNGARESRLF